jgi:alkylation response protein AidB-like acyl-CoA dehydrogenase
MSTLTAEQGELAAAVRALLGRRGDSAALRRALGSPRGYDEALWTTLCQQIGVAALSIPEKFGGLGAGALETHVVMDELGRTLTPSPLLGSAVLCGQLLVAVDDAAVNERLLPAIADGSSVASLAYCDADGWRGTPAVTAAGGLLTGTAHYALNADTADVVLVVAGDEDGLGIYEVDPLVAELTRTRTASLDLTRPLASVELNAAPGARLGAGDAAPALERALEAATIALTAEQVGAATRILEITVEYAKSRVQFGRPIGSFQALKHRMADLHVLAEAARSASYAAAAGEVAVPVAKAYCNEALFTIAAECIQLHGGIAITWEHDAHLYFKRAHGSAQLFGTTDQHARALAPDLGLEQGL